MIRHHSSCLNPVGFLSPICQWIAGKSKGMVVTKHRETCRGLPSGKLT